MAKCRLRLGAVAAAACFLLHAGTVFGQLSSSHACADVNRDEAVDLSDAILILNWLFLGEAGPDCGAVESCGDTTGDGAVNVGDAVRIIRWLILSEATLDCPDGARQISGFTRLGPNLQGLPEYEHEATGMVFVLLPGGAFLMGSPEEECGRDDDEGPLHEVTLSPFLIGKYEVSQAEWEAVLGENPSWYQGERTPPGVDSSELPVERVSWNDIQVFEERTGLRLPTEAQWEYACRAGTTAPFALGDGTCLDTADANFNGLVPYCETCPLGELRRVNMTVDSLTPNAFGLHHMHGNVKEWCEDAYIIRFYSSPEATELDPLAEPPPSGRVTRGGRATAIPGSCRSAERDGLGPQNKSLQNGFRAAFWPLP